MQTAEASSEWSQLLWPQSDLEQLNIVVSVPSHLTLSNHICDRKNRQSLFQGSINCRDRQGSAIETHTVRKNTEGSAIETLTYMICFKDTV